MVNSANTVRSVSRWAVGITTARRHKSTLCRCVASLADAGWLEPRLFVEPDVEVPLELASLPISKRDRQMGAFPNWYLGLSELFFREPRAEAYFMCQDDVIFSNGLRRYLEKCLWPDQRIGVVSIYCPSHYAKDVPMGFYAESRGWESWGALAYIFSNPGVRELLTDRLFVDHRHCGPNDGLRNIDSIVGEWCARRSMPYYVHIPSLAKHIGDTSTIFPGASNLGRRKEAHFVERIIS